MVTIRNLTPILIATIILCHGVSAQQSRRKGPIVKQVDRILIESSDPKNLFEFFADTLLLPIAWPVTDSQGFVSAALGAGNANLEFFRYAQAQKLATAKTKAARFAGIAFEPYQLANSLREMQVEGIPYDDPKPYISTLPKGNQGALWTTVTLPSLSKPGMSIFLYECNPEYLRSDVRRKQLANRLVLNNGGPLGLKSISEVVIESTNPEKDRIQWRKLLGAASPSGTWLVGDGPAIRVIGGVEDRIESIIFKVQSIAHAREFLLRKRLLGAVSPRQISLDPSKVQGLSIRIQE